MTVITEARRSAGPATPRLRWASLGGVERACLVVGAGLVAAGVFHLGVFATLGGPWDGPVSWRKPATFGLSFGLTLIGICWISIPLTLRPRTRTWLLAVFAADCVLEVSGITLQAWRHVPSHLNNETHFDTVVAMSLAVGGAVLIATLGTLTVAALRGQVRAARDFQLAVRAGLMLLMIGLATGVAMIVRGQILVKTGHRQAAYHTAGSLKWVHAVTLHAILVLPARALVLAARGWPEDRRTRFIAGATGLYATATIAVLLTALL